MKIFKLILLTLGFLLAHTSSYSQFRSPEPGGNECGTPEVPENLREVNYPRKTYRSYLDENDTLVIPTVFHILHTGTEVGELYNVSDEQINLAIKNLNDAFANRGWHEDQNQYLLDHEPPGTDTKLRFILAKRDPDGNPTNGIVRVNVSEVTDQYEGNGIYANSLLCGTGCEVGESALKLLSYWNDNSTSGNGNKGYMNVWVVNGIDGNVGNTGGIQGYSFVSPPIGHTDGIVIRYNKLSHSNGVSSDVFAHEVGHYMGLYHTFGPTNYMPFCSNELNCNNDGDQVCDTGPATSFSGCSLDCPYENVRNIMSYSNCRTMFSPGQSDRIWSRIEQYRPWMLTTLNAVPITDYDLALNLDAVGIQCTSELEETIKIYNYGSLNASGFTVKITQNSNIIYENYFEQVIESGNFITINHNIQELQLGDNNFEYEIIYANDEYTSNNTYSRNIIRDTSLNELKIITNKQWPAVSSSFNNLDVIITDPEGNCEICNIILDGKFDYTGTGCVPPITHSLCVSNNSCVTIEAINLSADAGDWFCDTYGSENPPWLSIDFNGESIFYPIPEGAGTFNNPQIPDTLNVTHTLCIGDYNPTSTCTDEDEDDICDYEDNCVGEYDAINQCNGTCSADEDSDGICDDIDPCVGIIDECGACNGPGAIFDCGCFTQDCEWCDCDGTKYDLTGTCGGDCLEDSNFNSICDRYEPCLGLTEPTYNGYTYDIVDIGQKCWFSENLRTTKFRNNQNISNIIDKESWKDLEEAGMCYYDNNESNGSTNGILYNWYAVNDPRGLCPSGWHVPTDEEWQDLERALGMNEDEILRMSFRSDELGIADKLKPGGTSGFNSLNSGFRHSDSGKFKELDKSAYYWTSTSSNDIRNGRYSNAYHRIINDKSNGISRSTGTWSTSESKGHGLSVRCVND